MEAQSVMMTAESARIAAEAVEKEAETTDLVKAAFLTFSPWLEAECAYPSQVSAIKRWTEYDGLGAGTCLVAAAVDRLRIAGEVVWSSDQFTEAVGFLENFAKNDSHLLDGTRQSVADWLFGQSILLEDMSAELWVLIEEAVTCRFRYENLKREDEDEQVPDPQFGKGAPEGVVLPAADAAAGTGGLGDIVTALGATQSLVSAMSAAFQQIAREGFAEKSAALAYVDAMTSPAPDPNDPAWTSPTQMARKMKDITNALDFRAEGCAMVNTAVIETLKGRPTVPTRRPGEGERWPAHGAEQLYGREGHTVHGMPALTAYLNAKAQHIGDMFHVEMVSQDPEQQIGHAVTVVKTDDGLLYVDVGLGGGKRRQRKPAGNLANAQWDKYGFEWFTVTYAGHASLDMRLDAGLSDSET